MRRKIFHWITFLSLVFLSSACEPFSSPLSPPAADLPPVQTSVNTPDHPESTQAPFQGPLSVILLQPGDNALVPASPVRITGEAEPGTVISFNDVPVIVDTSRKFVVDIPLEPGINTIEIVASDDQGNQDFKFLTLTLEQTTTP
jgi:hypothetical protein